MNAERKLNELTKELEALKVRLALLEKMALERTEKVVERLPPPYPYPTTLPYYREPPVYFTRGRISTGGVYECG